MEKPLYIDVKQHKLFGILHTPDLSNPVPGIIMCHGFTGSHTEAHFFFAKIARQLCCQGYAVLRFDFWGSGNSEGAFSDMSIHTEIDDALGALEWLKNQPEIDSEKMGVIGLSLGGCVAACVAGLSPDIKSAVLLSPVGVPDEDFASFLPAVYEERTTPALYVGNAFRESLKVVRPFEIIKNTNSQVLLIHGDNDETISHKRSDEYESILLGNDKYVEKVIIPDADHTFAIRTHEDQVISLISHWKSKVFGNQ